MSTNKEKDQEKPQVAPLKENETGQIEGGFSDISSISPDEAEPLNIALCNPNVSCKPSTTTPS